MPTDFEQNLENPVPEEEIKQSLEEGLEADYSSAMEKVRKKNLKKLIKLDFLEKERVAKYICDEYRANKESHSQKCIDLDKWDDIFRMKPITLAGDDGESSTYRTPLTTTTLEVVHANIMNVFFTPSKIMRVIPTEEGDVFKINKLDTFGNWSIKNELEIFENCDRLFHSSSKNGETPYLVYWAKEYGEEIIKEIIPNPANPSEPLLDEDGEPIIQEREVVKLLYNGPKLEVFSRKDYILPKNSLAGHKPDWEDRIVRLSADTVMRREEEGRYYEGTFENIGGWGTQTGTAEEETKQDKRGGPIPLGKSEKLFLEFYGTLRIKQVKSGKVEDEESFEELEDEFIGLVEVFSETLCFLKKNRFPFKERPIGMDEFIPDDEGRREGTGIPEFMEGIQNCNDVLFNQFVFGTTQSNNPVIFFTPMGNTKDAPIKIKAGYMYPTADPKSMTVVSFPAPNSSMMNLMEQVRYYAQLLFGIGDYASGIESTIDPTGPAKKAELVVAQGNVRLNLIIRRKNKTLKDIFRRWFLLYKENMPKNKFMRIAGDTGSWKFENIKLSDFALNSIPDFELTGNILNSNKTLEAQKKFAIYDKMVGNPMFSPQTQQGLQALHSLTKWLLDGMDELGLSNFLPTLKEKPLTPQEENARFIQGDFNDPQPGEDHVYHVKNHAQLLLDSSLPPEIIAEMKKHVEKTIQLLKEQVTMQLVTNMSQGGMVNGQPGSGNPQAGLNRPLQPAGVGMAGAGVEANVG